MNEQSKRIVALHEAGHVVARFVFRDCLPPDFDYVTIKPDAKSGSAGHVRLLPPGKRLDPSVFDFTFDDELNTELAGFSQRELEAKLSILLAGEAATYIETAIRDEVGTGRETWTGDFADAVDHLERIFPIGEDPEFAGNQATHHYLETLFWRTVLLLQRPMWWEQVEELADRLVKNSTLSYEECKKICGLDFVPPKER